MTLNGRRISHSAPPLVNSGLFFELLSRCGAAGASSLSLVVVSSSWNDIKSTTGFAADHFMIFYFPIHTTVIQLFTEPNTFSPKYYNIPNSPVIWSVVTINIDSDEQVSLMLRGSHDFIVASLMSSTLFWLSSCYPHQIIFVLWGPPAGCLAIDQYCLKMI